MISASSSENVGKYDFLTGEETLQKKILLEKPAIIIKCEYSPLGSASKKQTDIA